MIGTSLNDVLGCMGAFGRDPGGLGVILDG